MGGTLYQGTLWVGVFCGVALVVSSWRFARVRCIFLRVAESGYPLLISYMCVVVVVLLILLLSLFLFHHGDLRVLGACFFG